MTNSDLTKHTLSQVMVVVPALNEAANIGSLVTACLAQVVTRVIVVDNGSTDETAAAARSAGALVVNEPRRGYGYACAAGSTSAIDQGADIVVYIDADHSSRPNEMDSLLAPILNYEAQLVLGSRVQGVIQKGAMPPHQQFGNWLSARLMRLLYGVAVTDLGPYRAITTELLNQLDMQEMTFGWPTEMMVKAAKLKAPILEVPVSWDTRQGGESKVSGTIKGSFLAARHILGVTIRYSPRPWRSKPRSEPKPQD